MCVCVCEREREQLGDIETIGVKLIGRRLEWLGHLARMPEHRLPKMFGYLQFDLSRVREDGETRSRKT